MQIVKSQQEPPIISICVANYSGSSIIFNCLESIFRQECSEPFDVIGHDEASIDNSIEIIEKNFPDTKLIKPEKEARFRKGDHGRVYLRRKVFMLPFVLCSLEAQTIDQIKFTYGQDCILAYVFENLPPQTSHDQH